MRSSSRAALISALCVLGSALLCRPALAYCLATTCDPMKENCGVDAHGCQTKGHALKWKDGTLELLVDKAGSATLGISGADTQRAIEAALGTWMSADCPKGGHPSFAANTELKAGLTVEFDDSGPNENVVTYADDTWPYEPNAIAKALLAFELDTGDMDDADIIFNAAQFSLAIDPTSTNELDLEAVLTHEIGHVLGLAHSDAPGATMQPETQGFATAELKTLEPDDMAGICAIYPPLRKGSTTEPVTASSRGGNESSTCNVSPGRPSRSTFGAGLFALGIAGLLRRRADAKGVSDLAPS